jgi:hypothetical protein
VAQLLELVQVSGFSVRFKHAWGGKTQLRTPVFKNNFSAQWLQLLVFSGQKYFFRCFSLQVLASRFTAARRSAAKKIFREKIEPWLRPQI